MTPLLTFTWGQDLRCLDRPRHPTPVRPVKPPPSNVRLALNQLRSVVGMLENSSTRFTEEDNYQAVMLELKFIEWTLEKEIN